MKSLRQYLTESVHTYRYTIKIAGDLDKNFIEMFKYNLNKFDPVKIEEPKTTPVQKSPYGFPDLSNESVCIIKAEFKYPATEPQIQQIAQLLGKNIDMVRVMTSDYDDSITAESDMYVNQAKDSPILNQEEMPDAGKEASKEYANQYLDRVLPKKPSIEMQYDAKKTPTEKNTSKEGINTKSPMSKMTRPQLPQTGARK
jgi:hypothetical protein|tara:strand:- start:278 stop:874 length:597 start_codon:yes stop_codon:yes gene_type:complete